MAQEFTIKSTQIEDKINQLLPSQGGAGAGVDFSASTMVIPVVDLTETAEGSSLRQDLQSSFSHKSATGFDVSNTTSTIIVTTGYWRVLGTITVRAGTSSTEQASFFINNGTTNKTITGLGVDATTVTSAIVSENFDFLIKLEAGDSFLVFSSSATALARGSVRQIADINGNLINP